MLLLCACAGGKEQDTDTHLAIAWSNVPDSESYQSTIVAARETGADVVLLEMVRSADLLYDEEGLLQDAKDEHGILRSDAAGLVKSRTWRNSNVEEVMKDIDCLILPGGWDISPSLYRIEQPWHGIKEDGEYCAERDVSDYLLLSYCLDKDIPVYCICRGMQMLGVVSGAEMIQDIGNYFQEKGIEYTDMHRDPDRKAFLAHDVEILSHDSLIYETTGKDKLERCPSWHHQMVGDVSGTELTVTATTETNGVAVIEAVERKDKHFCIGVQFHPEIAVRKHVEKADDADTFMDYETAMSGFRALVKQGNGSYKTKQENTS